MRNLGVCRLSSSQAKCSWGPKAWSLQSARSFQAIENTNGMKTWNANSETTQ